MNNILFRYKSIIYYYIYDGVSELINVIYNCRVTVFKSKPNMIWI